MGPVCRQELVSPYQVLPFSLFLAAQMERGGKKSNNIFLLSQLCIIIQQQSALFSSSKSRKDPNGSVSIKQIKSASEQVTRYTWFQ